MPLFKSNKKDNAQQDKVSQIALERAQSSFSIADMIAPPAVEVNSNFIKLGEKYAKTFFILSYPGSIFSNWLSPITNSDRVLDISIHIGPTNAADVLHQLNRKITNIEALLGERERKGLIRDPELQKRTTILKCCAITLWPPPRECSIWPFTLLSMATRSRN